MARNGIQEVAGYSRPAAAVARRSRLFCKAVAPFGDPSTWLCATIIGEGTLGRYVPTVSVSLSGVIDSFGPSRDVISIESNVFELAVDVSFGLVVEMR